MALQGGPLMPTIESRTLQTQASPQPETLHWDSLDSVVPEDHRAYVRRPIECCRPIAVRCLDDDGRPTDRWFLADILDLGEGGMCLLTSGEQVPELGQWLLLDLRAHPNFGEIRLRARLRWFVRAHFALTFGVSFASPLPLVPSLDAERRRVRRDPNLEAWAFEDD